MARGATDFAKRIPKQMTAWAKDTWSEARDDIFTRRFVGTTHNSMIQKITELVDNGKGERCLFQLVSDLSEDGVVGDNQREGHEEMLENFWQEIGFDLLSHQVKNKGKLANKKTVLNFRMLAKERLAQWLSYRIDQLVFLTLAGINYRYNCDGSLRTRNTLEQLVFSADNTPLTAKRHLMWDGSQLLPSDTTQITNSFVLSYNMLLKLKAYARNRRIKPLKDGGKAYYVVLLRPGSLVQLKQDPAFQRAIVQGMPRGATNPFFTGGIVTVDGLVLHEHELVYNNLGAGNGNMWGAGGNVPGTRTQLCGAQALAMYDLGAPEWEEAYFDYRTKQGISIDKMFGLLRPKFRSYFDKTEETFGTIGIDHFLAD